MTTEERTFYISVIEKMARGEDLSDEELTRFSDDEGVFSSSVGRTNVTDEELQQISDSISVRCQERFKNSDVDCNDDHRCDEDDDFYDELMPFLSNDARMWLRRKGYIENVEIMDLNDYREASSFDPATLNLKSKEQLRRSLSVQAEKLNNIQDYVSELFISAIQVYDKQPFDYTDTIANLLYHVTQSNSYVEKLLDIVNAT